MNVYDCANELAKAIKESRELEKLQEVFQQSPETIMAEIVGT